MENIKKDFDLFARSRGISSLTLNDYKKFNSRGVNPMILEEREMNVIGLDVFSRLLYDRIIFLGDVVDGDSANIINSQMMYLNSIGDDDIKLFINSPGGSVTDGLAIYDVMNFVTPDVSTYCMGLSASMGAILLSSGTKGKRFSLPHGDIMIHQPLGQSKGQATDMRIEMEQMNKCQKTLYEILAENTSQDYQTIVEKCERNFWLTPTEAVNFGLIDEVVKKAR